MEACDCWLTLCMAWRNRSEEESAALRECRGKNVEVEACRIAPLCEGLAALSG